MVTRNAKATAKVQSAKIVDLNGSAMVSEIKEEYSEERKLNEEMLKEGKFFRSIPPPPHIIYLDLVQQYNSEPDSFDPQSRQFVEIISSSYDSFCDITEEMLKAMAERAIMLIGGVPIEVKAKLKKRHIYLCHIICSLYLTSGYVVTIAPESERGEKLPAGYLDSLDADAEFWVSIKISTAG